MNAVNFDMYDAGELCGHPVVALAFWRRTLNKNVNRLAFTGLFFSVGFFQPAWNQAIQNSDFMNAVNFDMKNASALGSHPVVAMATILEKSVQ